MGLLKTEDREGMVVREELNLYPSYYSSSSSNPEFAFFSHGEMR